jgi:urease alpha subunit
MATVLIKNGRIVTAVGDYQADILIEDGRIRIIGQGLVAGNNVETRDAIRGSARDAHIYILSYRTQRNPTSRWRSVARS